MISSESRARFEQEVAKYPADQRQSAVMACLAIAQQEIGYVSAEAEAEIGVAKICLTLEGDPCKSGPPCKSATKKVHVIPKDATLQVKWLIKARRSKPDRPQEDAVGDLYRLRQ